MAAPSTPPGARARRPQVWLLALAGRLPPRTLIGRAVLVVLLSVLVSNVVGLAVFAGERRDALTAARARQIAEQVATAATAVAGTAVAERRRLLRVLRQPGLRLQWSGSAVTGGTELAGRRAVLVRQAFREVLGGSGLQPERLRLAEVPPGAQSPRLRAHGRRGEAGPAEQREEDEAAAELPGSPVTDRLPSVPHTAAPTGAAATNAAPIVGAPPFRLLVGSIGLADGTWLNFSAPIAAFPPFWETPGFLVVLFSTIAVLAASVWAVRRATQPLAMFAQAAERLGRDVDAPPLPEQGPREVQQAAIAFNRMQQRLRQSLLHRTQMLAAISHDLRTPLTRLRLRAEEIADADQRRRTISDLDDMRGLIEAALAVARNEAAGERPARLDLAVLLQTVVEAAADRGARAAYAGPAHAPVLGRPEMLKRAFGNLVDNAVSYGGGAAVRLAAAPGVWEIRVEDAGPGIPEDQLERVFEPFVRLDPSRSRETGGVGLGLSLVRAAIEAHGGSVVLINRSFGGLCALVRLPRAAPGSGTETPSPGHPGVQLRY